MSRQKNTEGGRVRTSIQVPPDLSKRIGGYVGSQGRTKAEVIRHALDALELKVRPLVPEVRP